MVSNSRLKTSLKSDKNGWPNCVEYFFFNILHSSKWSPWRVQAHMPLGKNLSCKYCTVGIMEQQSVDYSCGLLPVENRCEGLFPWAELIWAIILGLLNFIIVAIVFTCERNTQRERWEEIQSFCQLAHSSTAYDVWFVPGQSQDRELNPGFLTA